MSVRKFTLMLHPLFTPIFKLLLTAAERADVQSRTSLTEGCGSAKYLCVYDIFKCVFEGLLERWACNETLSDPGSVLLPVPRP